MTEKICLIDGCGGVLKQTQKNEFEGVNIWVCECCGNVFKSKIAHNKKLRAYKITDKIDFIKWFFNKPGIKMIITVFILIKLVTGSFHDILGFIFTLSIILTIFLIYSFTDFFTKRDYLKTKGVEFN